MITAPQSAPPPEGIFPLSGPARPQLRGLLSVWGGEGTPVPAAQHGTARHADKSMLLGSVTHAVVAVSAAMRTLKAALEAGAHDGATIDRAMATLNEAVADQASAARRVLHHLEAEVVD